MSIEKDLRDHAENLDLALLIPVAISFVVDLIKLARKAKELDKVDIEKIRKIMDKEFADIPDWDSL